jgi:hypothetical protein
MGKMSEEICRQIQIAERSTFFENIPEKKIINLLNIHSSLPGTFTKLNEYKVVTAI